MKNKINPEDLIKTILQYPQGIALEELLKLFDIPRRTLQYKLSNLVKIAVLKREGIRRNSKYFINEISEKNTVQVDKISQSFIPLTSEAQQVKNLISVPIQLRQHVSYRREF